jgi:DNA polymerase-3 subunit beta
MKLTFNTSQLKTAYMAASAAVPTKTPKDILKCVLLQSTPTDCRLIGGDTDLIVAATVQTQEEHGEIVLPATVGQILREVVDEEITLEADEGRLIIQTSGSRFRLSLQDANDYPPPQIDPLSGATILGTTLSAAIDATIHCVDLDASRYALGGCCLDGDTVVATDSRRMSYYTLPAPLADSRVIVPLRACNMLRRGLGATDLVHVQCSENTIQFASESLVVRARLLEGRFPKWRDVVPRTTVAATCRVGELLRAVRLVAVTTDKESAGIMLIIQRDHIALESQMTTGAGNTQITCEATGIVSLSIYGQYLAQALACMPADDTVQIGAIDSESAMTLTHGQQRHIIMPLSAGG